MEIPPQAQPQADNSEATPTATTTVSSELDNSVAPLSDANGGGELDHKLSAEEVKGVLEIIASTGKFWHDWDELKSMLFFRLKQVLSEYPEAKILEDQPNSSLEESYVQLVKSLEEALSNFIEGPPFTLQRLCEILLNAQTIYPKLSKLALALEKNLLVTSTLTKSTDPYPPSTELVDVSEQVEDAEPLPQPQSQPPPQPQSQPQSPPHPGPLENGGELMTEDKDEVMSEVNAEADDGTMTMDMETFEEIVSSSSETSSTQPSNS